MSLSKQSIQDLRRLVSECQGDCNVLTQVESELEHRDTGKASRLLKEVKTLLGSSAETGADSLDQAKRLGDAWDARVTMTTDSLLASRRPDDALKASVSGDTILLEFRSGSAEEIPVRQVRSVRVARETETDERMGRHCWNRIRIQHAGGDRHVCIECDSRTGKLEKEIEDARRAWWRTTLASRAGILCSVTARLNELNNPRRYVDADFIRDLMYAANQAVDWFEGPWWPQSLSSDREIGMLRTILSFVQAPEKAGKRANEAFVNSELVRSRELFDRIESHPLTPEQRQAVVVDERHNLVIAAAGSGKTSVIVAKAAWLVQRGFQRPSELLLLAFARTAQDQMDKRLRARLGTARANDITVRTFHGLGSEIIGEAEGRRPSVASVAGDDSTLRYQLRGFVEALREDPKVSERVLKWFQHSFAPYKSQHEFKSWGEYYEYLRSFSIRALNGERVKSFEEVVIANFLYLNGVRYEYEAHYEHDTATAKKGQYKPDFYLPDYGVYIEHFGL